MTTSLRTAALILAAALAACSSGKSSPGNNQSPYVPPTGPQVAGIAVPREISALPARGASTSVSAAATRLASAPLAIAAASGMAAGTDYANAETFKFVDEQALAQFDILNTIFKALGETHYADPENVNTSAYKCMVTWDEKGGSGTGKQLIPWVVESTVTTAAAGAQAVNHVKVWMNMRMGDGQDHVIKVGLDIFQAPTQNADGSYADYGVWRMDAKFDEAAVGYFSATAGHEAGLSVIKIHQIDTGGGGAAGVAPETRGILKRSATSGYGAVSFPDWSSCHDPVCAPSTVQVSYAYNANHAALKRGATVVYKDRAAVVDIGNRYGLYDAVTGADVTKSRSFGFPVTFSDASGTHWGYYGAWQGRHQLGSDGRSGIPAGTRVTRADVPPGATAETFTASAPFPGTLVKRTLSPGSIQGLTGVVVQTWMNRFFQITWDGSRWLSCPDGQWLAMMTGLSGTTWQCNGAPGGAPAAAPTEFTDLALLRTSPSDPQKQVMINLNRQCQVGQPCAPTAPAYLVYTQTGLFYTGWTPSPGAPPPTSNGTAYVPQVADELRVNLSGPLYLAYDGAGFVSKTVASLDQQTMTPTFDPAGDVSYTLEQGREYYFNTPGVNYVVKAAGAGAYDVKVELQTVANPVTAATFVPAGTTFRQQWDQSACSATCSTQAAQSTYRFDAATMKLVYACVGTGDQQGGATVGAEVTTGQWGLVAYDASCTRTATQYNWDYPQGNQGWGAQQFLKRADGSYVILEDPIRLAPVSLTNHHGDALTLSLQFDGNWVGGLPDIYGELQRNQFVLTAAIADKVVLIPAGTEVVDAGDPTKHYLFKPLQLNEYLSVIADPGDVDPSLAATLDLSTVPRFVDAQLGATPDVPLKYSEGRLVQ
jgi:hypothetical protein